MNGYFSYDSLGSIDFKSRTSAFEWKLSASACDHQREWRNVKEEGRFRPLRALDCLKRRYVSEGAGGLRLCRLCGYYVLDGVDFYSSGGFDAQPKGYEV